MNSRDKSYNSSSGWEQKKRVQSAGRAARTKARWTLFAEALQPDTILHAVAHRITKTSTPNPGPKHMHFFNSYICILAPLNDTFKSDLFSNKIDYKYKKDHNNKEYDKKGD